MAFIAAIHIFLALSLFKSPPRRPDSGPVSRQGTLVMLTAPPLRSIAPGPQARTESVMKRPSAASQQQATRLNSQLRLELHAAPLAASTAAAVLQSVQKEAQEKIADAPQAVFSPAGRLNLDALKATARSIAHETAPRRLPGVDAPLTRDEQISEQLARAKRGDCRTEHAQLGILAIPFLIKDTVTNTGCKW